MKPYRFVQIVCTKKTYLFKKDYYSFTVCEFFTLALADGLSLESKKQQVTFGLHDTAQYLVDIKNAVILTFSVTPLISNSSSLLSTSLVTVPSVPFTKDINVILMFHNFLSSLAISKYLSLFSLSLIFTLSSPSLISTRFDLLIRIRRSVCISNSH